ncbi:unnamed protein product [Chondrus crispus]|uniref:Uncharacterized protein n=1 Tax=Chondrus crispus TaxID=2769 RepID=R7QS31_CHOCR|nr:unnamed protein product [Chondrus crispus]CDF41297.1 unnamed protein product [Chondrus crispus]|eukprot:XP_005711591.1 unnamed protein product [Chondrus crispus]
MADATEELGISPHGYRRKLRVHRATQSFTFVARPQNCYAEPEQTSCRSRAFLQMRAGMFIEQCPWWAASTADSKKGHHRMPRDHRTRARFCDL